MLEIVPLIVCELYHRKLYSFVEQGNTEQRRLWVSLFKVLCQHRIDFHMTKNVGIAVSCCMFTGNALLRVDHLIRVCHRSKIFIASTPLYFYAIGSNNNSDRTNLRQINKSTFYYPGCHCEEQPHQRNILIEFVNDLIYVRVFAHVPGGEGHNGCLPTRPLPEGTTRIWQQRPSRDNAIAEIIYVGDPSYVLYFTLRPQPRGHLHAHALAFSHSRIECLPTSLEGLLQALHSVPCGNWHLEIN